MSTPGAGVSRPLLGAPSGDLDLRSLLVDSVVDYAMLVLDTDGHIVTWNAGAGSLKGYAAEEIIGRHFSVFYPREQVDQGWPDRELREALEQGRWESEGWRVRKDGTLFWANVVITALHGADGRHRGFAKVTRDLTDRKRNEDALRAILEREREAAAKLRELDRMKTDLVAIVAHDLRAPVGVIQNLLELLESKWDSLEDEHRLDLVRRMSHRSTALAELVDDVFDLARLEAGQPDVNRSAVDVSAVVDEVVADIAVSHPDREVRVAVGQGVRALADERKTWQILSNLISNAVKYSPGSTPVDISVELDGDEIVVAVQDRGPGIAPDEEATAFARFGRLPGTSGTPGSGLGLFIARSLAEAQGGRLWIESAPGHGSTFRLALPAVESS